MQNLSALRFVRPFRPLLRRRQNQEAIRHTRDYAHGDTLKEVVAIDRAQP